MTRKDDAKIIQRVLEGDTETFAGLLERYEAKIYGLVVRLVGVEAEAEEVTQDAFVQAYTHLADFRARNRIYMLQYTSRTPMQAYDGKETIVIRMKTSK